VFWNALSKANLMDPSNINAAKKNRKKVLMAELLTFWTNQNKLFGSELEFELGHMQPTGIEQST
jgi:hypothetical protein